MFTTPTDALVTKMDIFITCFKSMFHTSVTNVTC